MTTRTDLTVSWELSPRIITVAAPSVELNMQDLVDTLRVLEDDLDEGLQFDHLIDTAGKEDLGGDVSVGITVTLNNARVAFEKRLTKLESGTVTTPDATGFVLTDSTALFVTNGVVAGDVIRNHTDAGSVAAVLSVDSETQITTDGLIGGTDNQFDSADVYDVLDWVQCNVSGGNLVAVDDVGGALDPVFPTFGTQVVRTSSSSATLQQLSEIQHASFAGHVHIDVANGVAGTEYPIGSQTNPVNNLADAVIIEAERGLGRLLVAGALTVGATDNIDNLIIQGEGTTFNIKRTNITLTSGCSTSNTQYFGCYVTGVQGGESRYEDCILETLSNSHCSYHHCGFIGTHTLPAGGFDTHTKDVIDCYTGRTQFTWDLNGSNMDVRFINFSGDIQFTNGTGATCNIYLHMNGGTVTLAASCTAGNIFITGNCTITDNSVGMTVSRSGMSLTAGAPMTENYPVDGQSEMTPEQALYAIMQMLSEFTRTGTVVSIKKRDGTEAFPLTLDSATAPTSSTQSG